MRIRFWPLQVVQQFFGQSLAVLDLVRSRTVGRDGSVGWLQGMIGA